MRDGAVSFSGHNWLGAIGNAEACRFHHRQIVGAITDGKGFRLLQALRAGNP